MKRLQKPNALLLVVSMLLLLLPAHANATTHSVRYRVYTDCDACMLPGGPGCNALTGEWILTCWDTWVGWGNRPGDACTWYEEQQLEPCDPQ